MVRTAMILPVKAVLALSTVGIILSEMPTTGLPVVDTFGRVSLEMALLAAVVALWRALGTKDASLEKKDERFFQMALKFTETTVTMIDMQKEIRADIARRDRSSK